MSARKETRARYLAELQANPLDDRHGTLRGYQYGCTCDLCLQTGREYQRAHYRAQKERERQYLEEMQANPNDPRHGTPKGYRYGCRCNRCSLAVSEYGKKQYREKTKPKPPKNLTARDIFLRERNLYRKRKRAQKMLANMAKRHREENGTDGRWEI